MTESLLEQFQAQSETLKNLSEAAHIYGVVLKSLGGRCVVACSDGVIVETAQFEDARSGSTVLLVQESRQIIKKTLSLGTGETAIVISLDQSYCEVALDNQHLRVLNPLEDVEEGCRIVLDASHSIVLKNLGPEVSEFKFNADTGVSWADIGGLADAKALMIAAIEGPTRHAALYKKYRQRRVKGIMLYGASGCGKTMLGKAAATAIRKAHGGQGADTCFIYVKGPQLLNKYVGNSESHVRSLFVRARSHHKKYGYPAIIFIDEADALLRSRDARQSSVSGMETTIVPQFLSEMDGLEESGALVILSTNIPHEIDAAIVREGRIDRKIKVPRPKLEDAIEIFRGHLKGRPLKGSLVDLATAAAKEMYRTARTFYRVAMKDGRQVRITLGDLTNGGMIAAVVDRATDLAIERDIREGKEGTGVTQDDLMGAIDFIDAQNRDVSHERDLQDLLEAVQPQVEEVQKVKGESYVSPNETTGTQKVSTAN
jgi:proteasome-associated ATPase